MAKFGEDEGEGPFLYEKRCFKHNKRLLKLLQVKLKKEEYHGVMMNQLPTFHVSYDWLVDNWQQLQ